MTLFLSIVTVLLTAVVTVLIISRSSWDGTLRTLPCDHDDCKSCPYGAGSGFCEFEKELQKGAERQ